MPRRKLSEYRAKTLVNQALGTPYAGWSIDMEAPLKSQLAAVAHHGPFAVKVDEGVKGRYKKGLVLLGITPAKLAAALRQLQGKGYRWLLVEPMVDHQEKSERYMQLSRERDGVVLRTNVHGGVDVEAHATAVQALQIHDGSTQAATRTGLSEAHTQQLLQLFDEAYMSTLEINPYVVTNAGPRILDAAAEVDDAGAYFTDAWAADDLRTAPGHTLTPQERTVRALDETSPASLKLDVINPDGAIFLLLSGGGASVAIADEVYMQGLGKQLGNYGEYSGNPTREETYVYTKAVLELLLASHAPKKVLFIGGAVANFTDIAATFAGVIAAIEAVAAQLQKQNVRVFVRRGGPRQEEGLARIWQTLERYGLLGAVHDPSVALDTAVTEALEALT